eukprot:7045329-Prymnesium_polylepis.1
MPHAAARAHAPHTPHTTHTHTHTAAVRRSVVAAPRSVVVVHACVRVVCAHVVPSNMRWFGKSFQQELPNAIRAESPLQQPKTEEQNPNSFWQFMS